MVLVSFQQLCRPHLGAVPTPEVVVADVAFDAVLVSHRDLDRLEVVDRAADVASHFLCHGTPRGNTTLQGATPQRVWPACVRNRVSVDTERCGSAGRRAPSAQSESVDRRERTRFCCEVPTSGEGGVYAW